MFLIIAKLCKKKLAMACKMHTMNTKKQQQLQHYPELNLS